MHGEATERYIARIRISDGARQGVFEHCDRAASLASAAGAEYGIGHLAGLTAKLHDCGKNTDAFLTYLTAAAAGMPVQRGSVTHAVHGAALVRALAEGGDPCTQLAQELCGSAIISHHGLRDCITEEGANSFTEAVGRIAQSYEDVRAIVTCHYGTEQLRTELCAARGDAAAKLSEIFAFQQANSGQGDDVPSFQLAMFTRLLASLLIDADHTDSACFEDRRAPFVPPAATERRAHWARLRAHCEAYLGAMQSKQNPSPLDQYRREISDCCAAFDGGASGVFRLIVPCGAGKTLSALRYALKAAEQYGKQHIFYIAPFHSILEQNAAELRRAVGSEEDVLEHHSNIVFEDEYSEQEQRYLHFTENWVQSPIVATTAVQFLNTLFDGKTSSVRRMQALGNSIIILDEVQALPIKVLCLFNLAMNFLAYFCKSTVVLCSATQPLLDRLSYPLCAPKNMLPEEERYAEAFRRVEIVDHVCEGARSYAEAASFVLEQARDVRSLLVVVNTKRCARTLFSELSTLTAQEDAPYELIHLSTNLYPAHRSEVLKKLKETLGDRKADAKVICVSTSLIEAGVDISFSRVIRSLAGLDSIVQAAGRCNRNRETDVGLVSVIEIRDEAVGSMGSFPAMQDACRRVLHDIRTSQNGGFGALSKAAMDRYYTYFYENRQYNLQKQMLFPLKDNPERTLIDLLTTNRTAAQRYTEKTGEEPPLLRQAFRQAGKEFAVIEDMGRIDVVVTNEDAATLALKALEAAHTNAERQKTLRRLQQYIVQVNETDLRKLNGAVHLHEETGVYTLAPEYYHPEFGLSETRVKAPAWLNF